MFQFTTTNVINSNKDITGLALWSEGDAKDPKGPSLFVKRVNQFYKEFVTHIYKAKAREGQPAQVKFDISSLDGKEGDQFRLNMYIRLTEGSNYSLYANDTYYKGKPFVVEFVWHKDAITTAKNLEKIVKKFALNTHYDKMVNFKVNGDMVIIDAVNDCQRFTKADIEKLDRDAYMGMGEYKVVVTALDKKDDDYDGSNTLTQGVEGFGTYNWILHNLRLPTDAHTRFTAINDEENPIPGATYNQYTIHYCVNRGTLGNNAVGDQVTSHTTHVFYVKSDLCAAFEAALVKIAPDGKLEPASPADVEEEVEP